MKAKPRYPIYVPSKGRAEKCLTARFLIKDKVPFHLVVEKEEAKQYGDRYGKDKILILPFSNRGSVIPARNWIKEHATEAGHKRHWQLDDNMNVVRRWYRGKRIRCNSKPAMCATEDLTDRYENVAISGLNYTMFCIPNKMPPFYLNQHVYSFSLILNEMPYEWRGKYNEDTDICLQVLSEGWCTILMNAFMVDKAHTMTMKGGNTSELYDKADGRLKMARSLERVWPGVVTTGRRFKRPQHFVNSAWRKFDNKLIRRKDIDWENIEDNEYGMKLRQVAAVIKSPDLQELIRDVNSV